MLQKKRTLHEGLLIRLGKRESESRGGEEDHFEEILKLSFKAFIRINPKVFTSRCDRDKISMVHGWTNTFVFIYRWFHIIISYYFIDIIISYSII